MPIHGDHNRPLFEREQELGRLSLSIGGLTEGQGFVAVVAGPAGIGKTMLLEATGENARAVGVGPLRARASELERDYAFGVVRQLLESAVRDSGEERRQALFAGPAVHAAATLGFDPGGAADRDLHSTLHGLYWLLVNLSSERPQLLVIDDLQWADEPSVRWLAYLRRRIDRLPIALVAGVRTDPSGTRPELPEGATGATREVIAEVLDRDQAIELRPGPLALSSVRAMLERELGSAGEPGFAEACLARTGGNAFLLSELIAELSANGMAPKDENIHRLEEMVPERIGDMIRRHLGRLDPGPRGLVTAAAVLGDGTDLPVVAELAGMPTEAAATAASELIAAQILDDTPEVRFRHPLLRAAVRAETLAPELASLHARAARVLAEAGAPDGLVGAQLTASAPGGGDPWVVERLRSAAASARSQGAVEQAVILLRRALAEPPGPDVRLEALRELGMAQLTSGEPAGAESFLEALELTADPLERARLAHLAGMAMYYEGRHPEAVDLLTEAAEQTRETPGLREEWLRIEALLGLAGRYDLTTTERVRGRLAAVVAGLDGSTGGERLAIATYESEVPGPAAADLASATRANLVAMSEFPSPDPFQRIGPIAMFLHAGRPDEAVAEVDGLMAEARETGSPLRNAVALLARGSVALDRGDLPDAEDDFRDAYRAGVRPVGLIGFLVQTLALCGSLDEADRLLDEHGLTGELERLMLNNPLIYGRGCLRFAQRDWRRAVADFRELGSRYEQWNIGRPNPPWRSSLALSLLAAGEPEEALGFAEEELAVAEVWDTPKAIATARRAVALCRGDGEAISGLTAALDLLEGTAWRFDRARVRCDLGSALRREGQRRAGREQLALGMDEAHACGAEPLAAFAAEELRASGARPRRRAISGIDALTPSEFRVAKLAAEGRLNREIAQELFVTMATVETHLTRTYRKLDVDGRSELAEVLDKSPGHTA